MSRPRATSAPHERGGPGGAAAPLAARLFARLGDGRFHSGEALAAAFGVSRSAIWKAAASLRELGLTVNAVRNRGYRLPAGAEPLDAGRIRTALPQHVAQRVRALTVAWSLGSTNAELLARTDLPHGRSDVLLAEHQSAGRGRRGRSWLAPPGGAICLSLSRSFALAPRDMGALGLAVGVCVLRALGAVGLHDVQLKWPNDVLARGRKLAGVLIELRAEAGGPAYVVIGIGLNVSLGEPLARRIAATGLEPVDVRTVAGGEPVGRNRLAAELVAACVQGLDAFEQHGLRPFVEEWRRADALRGRPVTVHCGESPVRGIARGVDAGGALLVETPAGLQKFFSGEVSVRLQE